MSGGRGSGDEWVGPTQLHATAWTDPRTAPSDGSDWSRLPAVDYEEEVSWLAPDAEVGWDGDEGDGEADCSKLDASRHLSELLLDRFHAASRWTAIDICLIAHLGVAAGR